MHTSVFDANRFYRNEVNARCNLQTISDHDAFNLYSSAVGFVSGLSGLRRLLRRLPAAEVEKLLTALTWQGLATTPKDAAAVAELARGAVAAIAGAT